MRLPRTTGALSGFLIVLLGLWGGLIPFIGPYFHYAFGGYQTWHYTSQRLWLCIVPGAAAVIGGLMLLGATTRVGGLTAGWVALAAGAWFAVGPTVSLLWHHTIYAIGTPAGGYTRQMLEWVGYFYGLGAAIVGLAAFAMGRYFSRPRIVEEPVRGRWRGARRGARRRPTGARAVDGSGRRIVRAERVGRGVPRPLTKPAPAAVDEPAADAPATTTDEPATTTSRAGRRQGDRRRPGLGRFRRSWRARWTSAAPRILVRMANARGDARAAGFASVSADLIVSYDGTANDDDALALGKLLAGTGATLALAYIRHSREFDPAP